MATFIIYLIRWAVCLTLLYSLFGLFLKRETLHSMNRIVLLTVLVSSMVLPLCQIETDSKNIVTQSREMIEHQIANVQNPLSDDIKRITISNPETGVRYTHIPIRDDVNAYILIAIAIYLAGLIVCWLRYFWQMAALTLMIRHSNRISVEGVPAYVHVVTSRDVKAPCSWMRWIILNPDDVGIRAIINHEMAHIRLGHSWDMLLCEFTCRTLWFLPFVWMLRQDLRDVHEFQADRRVLKEGIKDEEYQLLLIKKATSTGLQPVVNAFNQSPIKRRFKMMYKKPSRRWVALKAAYLLPLSALAVVAFARPQAISEIEQKVEAEVTKAVATDVWTNDEPVQTEPTEPVMLPAATAANDTVPLLPDANLVNADLAELGQKVLGGSPAKPPVVILDSTMQAVGARKIAEGIYVGHFQPNLNSDTVSVADVTILNRESKQTAEHRFAQNAANPNAYNITLNAETRKDRTGYYIRYMQPVASTQRNYDKKVVDPKMLSTDSLLTGRSSKHLQLFQPVAIERKKKETRVYMYMGFMDKQQVEIWRQQNINMYSNLALVDEQTGDKYVCRSIDYAYFMFVKDEDVTYVKDRKSKKDTISVYQICLIFPPLSKKMNTAYFGQVNDNGRYTTTFELNAIPSKGRVITK